MKKEQTRKRSRAASGDPCGALAEIKMRWNAYKKTADAGKPQMSKICRQFHISTLPLHLFPMDTILAMTVTPQTAAEYFETVVKPYREQTRANTASKKEIDKPQQNVPKAVQTEIKFGVPDEPDKTQALEKRLAEIEKNHAELTRQFHALQEYHKRLAAKVRAASEIMRMADDQEFQTANADSKLPAGAGGTQGIYSVENSMKFPAGINAEK